MSPLYDFACECGQESSTHRPMSANTTDKACASCGEAMSRRFCVFGFARFAEHFNPAVGKVVGSAREFREDLKRASEKATMDTGIPHSFVPVDIEPRRIEGPGTDSQARKHRELGTPGWERKRNYY